ncbi:hypothetical protein QAD02_024471 [Eretmocerus hayati]|nr:hypothetical protein QAD02_024471 [Eretmocerus hayati]
MTEIEWISRRYDYHISKSCNLKETNDHPLKPVSIAVVDTRSAIRRTKLQSTISSDASTRTPTPTKSTVPVNISSVGDPLSGHSSLDGFDPLTQFIREEVDPLTKISTDEWDYSPNAAAAGKKIGNDIDELVEPWSSRRVTILNKYTTVEKLSIITSFLPGGEKVTMKVHPSGALVDKVKTRLEQLDDFEDGSVRQMHGLSQQEYINRIEQLNNELVNAWNSDQRVKALKIAIQCAKLLADTAAIQFYPSKFVLVTDILDIFGKLVYGRLKSKAECIKPGSKSVTSLPDEFTSDMVPESAKETCQNWFYKIASIRELVPRLYVEMAIIKSYSFLSTWENFYDFLFTYRHLFSPAVKSILSRQSLSLYSYLNLYKPALDWILQVLGATASETILTEVLTKCKEQQNSALLVNVVLTSFKPMYVVPRAMEFVNLIETCEDNGFPQYHLYRSLGESFIKESPPKEHRKSILDTVWKYMKNLKDATRFMLVMEVWIQFAAIHFSTAEIDLFLGEIISHLGSSRVFENFYPQLQSIAEKIVMHTQDFDSLLAMENFLPFIDLFQKENIRVEVCKTVIEGISKQNSPIVDPIVINALMFIMRIMHDSVSALTVEDEKRQIGQLICAIIQRIDHGRDFEKQLNFYVETRGAFHNLDIVHVQLVQCVNRLSVDTRKIVRGHHTRRTSAFVRSCAAFCFITIPSLTLVHTRLQLYLLSGQVALLNQCYGQADACFKAALSLVPEMPKFLDIDGRNRSSEPYLLSYLSNFLSTLLVVPDSPEHGVLYLMRGLLNAVQRYFDDNNMTKSQLYLRVLDLLSTMNRETYPYHIDKVDSNDKLYGSDQKFISEVDKMCSKILEELLSHLKNLGVTGQLEKQSTLALELFIHMIIRADLTKPPLSQMAIKLWNLSQKHNVADTKQSTKALDFLVRRSELPGFEHLSDMLKKISK